MFKIPNWQQKIIEDMSDSDSEYEEYEEYEEYDDDELYSIKLV